MQHFADQADHASERSKAKDLQAPALTDSAQALPLVRVDNVSHRYPGTNSARRLAVENVSFDVTPGEFVCLVGASGCGKSTLLRILAGLIEPTTGTVYVDGQAVRRPGADRGMVFQEYAVFPWMTVRKNVEYGLRLKGVPAAKRRELAEDWLQKVGLPGVGNHYPKSLSGGMKQRVAVARALAPEPRILLMDEPFAAVDAIQRKELQEELRAIWEKTGITIVFVTHAINEALFLGTRVVVLEHQRGRLVADLPIPEHGIGEASESIFSAPQFVELRLLVESKLRNGGNDVK